MQTIFNITGRVNFLDMPILDKIEKDHEEWEIPNIPKINGDRKVEDIRNEIMQEHYFQQIPAIIQGFAKKISIIDELKKLKKDELEEFDYFFDLKSLKEDEKNYTKHYTYNETNFKQNPNNDLAIDQKLRSKNPFNNILDLASVWFKRTTYNFKTIPVRSNTQKLICNVAFEDEEIQNLGFLDVTLLHPLWIRNIPLSQKRISYHDGTKYSEVEDIYQTDSMKQNHHIPFNYTQTNHLLLKPTDCLYLPNHWWIQIVFDDVKRDASDKTTDPINKEPRFDNATVAWVEYHYPTKSTFEDVLLEGLMEGYGS